MTFDPKIYIVEDVTDSRLDRWLKKQVPNLHQGLLEKLLRLGKIRVNDRKVKAGERISNGDVVSLLVDTDTLLKEPVKSEKAAETPIFAAGEQDWFESLIIWEDDDLLVLNKPHGLAVQGGTKTQRHVDYYLTAYGSKKNCRYRLVHRIDRDTSGILLIAKTGMMATYLTDAFKQGSIEKTYWAIVLGQPKPGSGVVNAPLIKAGSGGDREKVIVDREKGKPAKTRYQTIKKLVAKRLPELTWLELHPQTGRTHQIRVHCQYLETPIVGDGKYGGHEATAWTRIMHLHARTITFRDPEGHKYSFSAPPPDHFIDTFRQYNLPWDKI